jgi:hypothetical protein
MANLPHLPWGKPSRHKALAALLFAASVAFMPVLSIAADGQGVEFR